MFKFCREFHPSEGTEKKALTVENIFKIQEIHSIEMPVSSNTRHTMTVANSIIGASILSMPFCFKQCGVVLGAIILYLNSVMTKLCCHQLIKASLLARRRNYEALAYDVMGPLGKLGIEVCIIGYLVGCCIAYVVVLGDLGPELLSAMGFNYSVQASRIILMTAISVIVILPLSLLKDIETLNVMSTISVGIYLMLVLKSLYEAGFQGLTQGISPNIEIWRFDGVLQCIPIFSMALSCQTQVFEVYDSLPEPSLKVMDRVVSSAIDLCTFIYMGVGIAGYLAFAHTSFTGNILVSFAPSPMTDLMKLGFLISIILSYPLCVLPCRTSLNSLIFGKSNNFQLLETGGNVVPLGSSIPDLRFKCLTTLIVIVTLIIGICIPNVEFVLGLVGATLGTTVCCVAPAWIYLKVSPSSSNERWIAKVLLVCGLTILVLGTTANIYAEEEYSETHSVDRSPNFPPNLKELDSRFEEPNIQYSIPIQNEKSMDNLVNPEPVNPIQVGKSKLLNKSGMILLADVANLVPDVSSLSAPRSVSSEDKLVSNNSASSIILPHLPIVPELLSQNIIPGLLSDSKD